MRLEVINFDAITVELNPQETIVTFWRQGELVARKDNLPLVRQGDTLELIGFVGRLTLNHERPNG